MSDAKPKNAENTANTLECGGEAVKFDYAQPAEVFTRAGMIPPTAAGGSSQPEAPRTRRRKAISYKRFASGAEAVRYAIEELPPAHLPASVVVVNGERYDGSVIRGLYDSADYPLNRRTPVKKMPRPRLCSEI